jgi:hypothetical protein
MERMSPEHKKLYRWPARLGSDVLFSRVFAKVTQEQVKDSKSGAVIDTIPVTNFCWMIASPVKGEKGLYLVERYDHQRHSYTRYTGRNEISRREIQDKNKPFFSREDAADILGAQFEGHSVKDGYSLSGEQPFPRRNTVAPLSAEVPLPSRKPAQPDPAAEAADSERQAKLDGVRKLRDQVKQPEIGP